MRKVFISQFALLIIAFLFNACDNGPTDTAPATPVEEIFWSLNLTERGVTLALTPPFDTITMIATPVNYLGQPMTLDGATKFTSSDTSRVKVDSLTGRVQAFKVGTQVRVIAQRRAQNVLLADTALVNITATATQVGSFSIQNPPPDSTTVVTTPGDPSTASFNYGLRINPRVADVAGNAMSGLSVYLWTPVLATRILDVNRSQVPNVIFGRFANSQGKLYGRLYAYGKTFTDSVTITTKGLGQAVVEISNGATSIDPVVFYHAGKTEATIEFNGAVTFLNRSSKFMDVIFDDTTDVVGTSFVNPQSGCCNIVGMSPNGQQTRRFRKAGTYGFRSRVAATSTATKVFDGGTFRVVTKQ